MKTQNLFFVSSVLILTIFFSCQSKAKFGEPTTVYVKDGKGIEYPVIAVSGQAIVFFRSSPFDEQKLQKKIIEDCDGKIIEHIFEINYYLVKTKQGKETEFVEKIKQYREVNDAYVNQVSSSTSTAIDIIDDFTNPTSTGYIHGEYVEKSAKDVCPNSIVSNMHDVNGSFSDANVIKELHNIFSTHTDNTMPVLINMSFGQYIYRMEKVGEDKLGKSIYDFIKKDGNYVSVKWDERGGYTEDLWNVERNSWINRYKDGLVKLAKWLSNYSDKEFIVTKASGNDGCHKLDSCVLGQVSYELYSKQFANAALLKMLNERIILVSAKDDVTYNGQIQNNIIADYANSPKYYHKWVTTLDISHLKYPNGKSIDGTSFSAPLLLGHIACLFDKYGFCSEKSKKAKGITLKEMVSLIKNITEKDARKNKQPGLLDIEMLGQKAKNLHLNFADSKWEIVYVRGMLGCTYCYTPRINSNLYGNTECRCTIEFYDNDRFRQSGITSSGETLTDEGTYEYKGILEDRKYNYPAYGGWGQEPIFGDVGEYSVVGVIHLKYDSYGSGKYISVLDRPIPTPTPSGKSARLEVDDHRTIGCTMWFGGTTNN